MLYVANVILTKYCRFSVLNYDHMLAIIIILALKEHMIEKYKSDKLR